MDFDGFLSTLFVKHSKNPIWVFLTLNRPFSNANGPILMFLDVLWRSGSGFYFSTSDSSSSANDYVSQSRSWLIVVIGINRHRAMSTQQDIFGAVCALSISDGTQTNSRVLYDRMDFPQKRSRLDPAHKWINWTNLIQDWSIPVTTVCSGRDSHWHWMINLTVEKYNSDPEIHETSKTFRIDPIAFENGRFKVDITQIGFISSACQKLVTNQ